MLSSHALQPHEPSLPLRFRSLTLNCGFLPHHLEYNNSDQLKSNLYRAEVLARIICEKNYDFVCLQEVWDTRVVARLEELLKASYPFIARGVHDQTLTRPNVFIYRRLLGKDKELYVDESLTEQLQIHLNRGGLMFLSKAKILDKKSESYDNPMLGEETMAQKGYTAYKLAVGPNHFISVAFTHMHANGPLFEKASVWWGGTSSHRRGAQHAMIHNDIIRSGWYREAPHNMNLAHLDTFFMGDMNTTFDSERQMLFISGGRSATNGFDQEEIKSDGGLMHMFEYEPVFPENFQEIREPLSSARGVPKQILPELVEKAEREHKLTGTDILNKEPPMKLIDLVTIKKNPDNVMGKFVTNIIEFFDSDNADLFDHRGIEADYDATMARIPRKSNYADYVMVPGAKIDPSSGWWDRTFSPRHVQSFIPSAQADNPVRPLPGSGSASMRFFTLTEPSAASERSESENENRNLL